MKAWPRLLGSLEPQAAAVSEIARAAEVFFKKPNPDQISQSARLPSSFPAAGAPMALEAWDLLGRAAKSAADSVEEARRLSISCDKFMAEMSFSTARAAQLLHKAVRSSNGKVCAGLLVEARKRAAAVQVLGRKARLVSLEATPVTDGLKAQVVYSCLRDCADCLAQAADGLVQILAQV